MTAIYLSQLTVDSSGALDPTSKFQRIYVDSGNIAVPAGVAISGPVAISSLPPPAPTTPVGDSQSAAAAFTATLAGAAGKVTSITGFDLTVPAVLALAAALVTITGLAGFPSGTLSFALSLLTTGTQLVWRPPAPLPASAANTAIVVHVPATIAGTWLNVYGLQA